MHFHYAYGLRLAADRPISGLFETPPGNPDLTIWFNSTPTWVIDCAQGEQTLCYVSREKEANGKPTLVVSKVAAGAYFRLEYADGVTFILNETATGLAVAWPDHLAFEDSLVYLTGPVLGFVLRLRGVVCLHASAVVVDDGAIAFLGAPGAGKSTTAAAFVQRGYAALSDDVAALDEEGEGFLVRPGYPRLCLWPDAVQTLFGTAEALPRLTSNWEKRYASLNGTNLQFQHKRVPLRVIYLLAERSSEGTAPRVSAVPPAEAMIALVRHTYINYLLDKDRRASEFEFLGRLLHHIPLRQVTPNPDLRSLSNLCDVLLRDFRALPVSRFAATHARPG